MNKKSTDVEEYNSIEIISLLRKIFNSRSIIAKVTTFFFIVGVIYSLISPIEFTASSTFINQNSLSRTNGNLSSIASIAGINLDNSSVNGEIPEILYPKILNSVSVMRSILEIEIPIDSTIITFKEYLLKKPPSLLSKIKSLTIGLPSLIFKEIFKNKNIIIESKNPMVITYEEKSLFNYLKNNILININSQDGFVEISVKSDNPKIAAFLTTQVVEILQKKIIDFKIQHAKEYLNFTQNQFKEKQIEYYNIQDILAIQKDKNKSINSELYLNQLKQIEGQLLISQTIYEEIARQVEQAKLQVAKDTPIFSTIEKATIPTKRSAPKRTIIVITTSIIGLLISIAFIIIKDPIIIIFREVFKKQIK